MAGEYTGEVVLDRHREVLERAAPRGIDTARHRARHATGLTAPKRQAAELLGAPVPARPPGFCIGCPERPVFWR